MRVTRLEITNFRGIQKLVLEPGPALTVLVGVNGTGKTTVLQALAMLLNAVYKHLITEEGDGFLPDNLEPLDFHDDAETLELEITVAAEGEPLSWRLISNRVFSRAQNIVSLGEPGRFVSELKKRQRSDKSVGIPLAVYFPINRAWLDIPERIRTSHVFDQIGAWENALNDNWNNFRLFFEWFRDQEDFENERRIQTPSFRDPQLEAVRQAVSALMEGFNNLRIERQPARMVIDKGGAKLVVNQLSDGEKCMLALAGDLARRLALANPGSPSPLQCQAIVMIDEIELHLHPRWQRRVVPALRRAFPECQFIVSTHSPQVLASVPPEDIVLLRRVGNQIEPQGVKSSYGRDTNWILEVLMEVDERPASIKKRIERGFTLIDENHLAEARREMESLESELGADDPELVRMDMLLRRKELLSRAPNS